MMVRTLLICFVLLLFGSVTVAEDWTEFRGPQGLGHSAETGLPTKWSPTKNVVWNVKIPGKGWSSPIYYDGKIYLTSAVDQKKGGTQSLGAICIDAKNGKTIWQKKLFDQKRDRIHGKNSHASPTPITDGKYLYVHFGTHGTACLSLDGKVIWKNNQLKYRPQHGNGGSPVLVDDLLVVACDGIDVQFVVALDQKKWQTPLEEKTTSYGL